MARRLAPLYIASALQWMNFWVGTDKPFMQSIGFTATLIGLAAAGYAIVAPSLEVPFGLLADRWTRIGVLRVGAVALVLAVVLQGISTEPASYVAGKLILAVFWAATSGTYESLLYDTLAQAGRQASFAARLGWFRLIGMSGGALGALGGGVIATFNMRLNYALSAGTAIAALAALLLVREPRVHLAAPRTLAGGRLRATVATIVQTPGVLRAVLGIAVCAALLQAMLEFGQFWLLAAGGQREWFGLGFAGLLIAAGMGGVISSRLPWDRRAARRAVGGIAVAAALILSQPLPIGGVIVAQSVLAACAAAFSVALTRGMHDHISSAVRTGVASVAALVGWLAFLPLAVLSGWFFDLGGIALLTVPVLALAVAAGALASRSTYSTLLSPRGMGLS